MKDMKEKIKEFISNSEDKQKAINEIKTLLYSLSDMNHNPVDNVLWVDIDMVEPNDYNPNAVANIEMNLLYTSIKHDGYTQPIVTIFDKKNNKYIIVDGFHRYFVEKSQKDILEGNKYLLPIVVIDKDFNDRMASTIRHNRARGKHSVQGMSSMVFKMLDNGWADKDICNHLGMGAEELLKLKHLTGFSKLFKDTKYHQAWETNRQIELRVNYEKNNKE